MLINVSTTSKQLIGCLMMTAPPCVFPPAHIAHTETATTCTSTLISRDNIIELHAEPRASESVLVNDRHCSFPEGFFRSLTG